VVNSASDLPTPVGGVHTLADSTTYIFPTTVDLVGNRIVGGVNSSIFGYGSDISRIKSTGLVGTALITSALTLNLNFVSLEANVALSLDGDGTQDLNWIDVRFINCQTVGRIADYETVLLTNSELRNSNALTFDGTIQSVGLNQCQFTAQAGGTLLVLPSSFSGRFRITEAALVVLPGQTGINVNVGATIPEEGYVLQSVAFLGGGTYLTGVLSTDNKSQFTDCRGIPNSTVIAQYYTTNNVTSTPVSVQSTFVKVLGTTTSGPFVERFSLSNNRATYIGARTGFFKVSVTLSLNSGNNQLVLARVAVNGVTLASSESQTTTSSAGRSENMKVQAIVQLTDSGTDFVEVWITNGSATTAITVTELNVIVEWLEG